MSQYTFPHIRVKGSPRERGRQYGQKAAAYIRRNITIYQTYFDYIAGWGWEQATDCALAYEGIIHSYRPHFLDEIRGIAEGAGVPYCDILALNVRTEIRNAAITRLSSNECTAFVALPPHSTQDHTLIGQNWDWLTAVAKTVVLLEVEDSDRPNFVTVVEAGLLAKAGMNSAGVGLATNALHCDLEKGDPGVPYHAVLRGILEAEKLSDAIVAITSHPRASSANYLVAHQDGVAFNAEAAPGDFSRVYITFPAEDTYAHTNHYLSREIDFKDLAPWYGPGSLVRFHRMDKFLKTHSGTISISTLRGMLADHFNYPSSICSHPDLKSPEQDRFMTVASLIMDLNSKILWLADGNPCETPYREITFTDLLI